MYSNIHSILCIAAEVQPESVLQAVAEEAVQQLVKFVPESGMFLHST